MGRSKRQTRSVTSNQRLRSNATTHRKSRSVPYGGTLSLTTTYRPYNYELFREPSRTLRPTTPTRSKPHPRRDPAPYKSLTGPLQQGVWTQTFQDVPETPRTSIPTRTMVCVLRQQRREVLHATNKTGKSGQKSPIYNRLSKIHCKGGK